MVPSTLQAPKWLLGHGVMAQYSIASLPDLSVDFVLITELCSFHPWLLSQLKDILEGVQTNSGLTVQELTQAFDEIKSTLASKLFTRWSSQFGSRRALSPYQLNDDCVAQLVSFGPIVAGFVTQALTDQRRRKVLDKLDEAEVLIRRQQLKLGDIVRIRAEVEALLSHAPHQHSMGRRAYLAYPDVARRSRF
ncbi:hypothetical protein JCM3765_006612 [Sporobolomyces pararoseus]